LRGQTRCAEAAGGVVPLRGVVDHAHQREQRDRAVGDGERPLALAAPQDAVEDPLELGAGGDRVGVARVVAHAAALAVEDDHVGPVALDVGHPRAHDLAQLALGRLG
jgi:hypothetical protein